jgi:hypothetical protein
MPKTWNEKLRSKNDPHVSVIDKPFGGLQAGQKLFIASPLLVKQFIDGISHGKTVSVAEMRERLAKKHKADGTCAMSTGIFVRIAAEAAWEDMQNGAKPEAVTPFWRMVEPGTPLARKLACGNDFIERMRAAERG